MRRNLTILFGVILLAVPAPLLAVPAPLLAVPAPLPAVPAPPASSGLGAQRGGRGFGDRDIIPEGSRVRYALFRSEVLDREIPYALYLPPSYEETTRDYPVLFFLHGANENERRWSTRGLTDIALDRMVADGEIGEFIVAIPFAENSFYTNSIAGELWEDMILVEFIPMIERENRAVGTREGRAISGISMGGYGALKLAMQRPDLFNAVSAHSAMLIDDFEAVSVNPRAEQLFTVLFDRIFGISETMEVWDTNNPLRMAAELDMLDDLAIYFDCGTEDEYGFYAGAERLHEILDEGGIAHEFHLYPGTHGWDYAREHTPASLAFHWEHFSAE
jgi:S-formylglutathione hydrolase FrmB